jgi:hypothetical protein
VLAKEHPNRLASQRVLTLAYLVDGQIKKVIKLLEHVVVVNAKVLTKEHPNRLAS